MFEFINSLEKKKKQKLHIRNNFFQEFVPFKKTEKKKFLFSF